MRYKFSDIIHENPDGSFMARVSFKFGGLYIGKGGSFSAGIYQNEIDIVQFRGHDTDKIDGTYVINGFY